MKTYSALSRLIVVFVLSFTSSMAQLTIEWQRCYGGSGFDQPFTTERTMDGGFISAGFSNSTDGDVTGNKGNYDWWIVKADKDGNIQWQRTYGGNNYDKCRAIMQNDDGTYMAFGSAHSGNGDVPSNAGEADFWLLKLDSVGNILQNQVWGGSQEEGGRGIIRTADRGWMLVGWAASNDGDIVGNNGTKDAWLCKLDSNGVEEWSRCYGGSLEDRARYVVQLPDGGYVFGGNAKSSDGDLSINQGGEDFWIAKVDALGNLLWNTPMGSSGDDRIYYVAADWDGGFIGIGRNSANDGDVTDNHGMEDLWIVKVDSLGNPVWNKSLGGSNDDGGFRIESTADHGYFIAGMTKSTDGDSPGNYGVSDYWFIKLDSTLNFVWNDVIGGTRADHCNDILKADDGGYFLTGFTLSNDSLPLPFNNNGTADYYFVKAFFCENKETQITVNGNSTLCAGNSVVLDAGGFQNFSWNTGDSTQVITVADSGYYYAIMSDYKGYCTYNSDSVYIGLYPPSPAAAISAAGNDLVASGGGSFQWMLNGQVIPGANNDTLFNINQGGLYSVITTDANGCSAQSAPYLSTVGVSEFNVVQEVSVSPNPFSDDIQITLISLKNTPCRVSVSNITGHVLSSQLFDVHAGMNILRLPLNTIAAGAYFLTLTTEQGSVYSKRIIKQ